MKSMASMETPFTFLPLGAIIQSFKIGGIDIVLGFPTQDQYVKYNTPYFGETIGRVANRVKNAQINDLNGKSYSLTRNDGRNSLHGGNVGWGKRLWKGPNPIGMTYISGIGITGESVTYTLISEDGEEGYPGTVGAKVTYSAGKQDLDGKVANILCIEYEAELLGGAEETAINLTNHSYFNLSNNPTIDGTVVTLGTNQHLPFDETSVPTGSSGPHPLLGISNTFTLTSIEPEINSCFSLTKDPSSVPIDTRNEPLKLNISAYHATTGIHLDVLSTEPSFQFYTGDFIDVPATNSTPARGKRSAFCCEPGRFVNACNVPEWKAMTVLKKGSKYGARIVYRAWSD